MSSKKKTDQPTAGPTEPVVPTQAKKVSTKSCREMDVASSDRIQLIEQANDFVRHMVDKEIVPTLFAGFSAATVERSQDEQATYSAALGFLRRQFEVGYRERDVIDKKIEHEESVEM